MNQQQFEQIVNETVESINKLLVLKGSEYASDNDRLINFKKGAEETGLTPLQIAFVYMRKHYDSVATYVRKDAKGITQTLSEPIEGRFDDLINYCLLMKALIKEVELVKKADWQNLPPFVNSTHDFSERCRQNEKAAQEDFRRANDQNV